MFPWSISWKASTPTSIRSSGSSGPLPTLAIHSSLHCYIPAVSHCVNLHLYSFCYAFWDADSSYLHLHVSRTHPAHQNFQEYLVLQLLFLICWFHIFVLKTSCVWTKHKQILPLWERPIYCSSTAMKWRLRSPILTKHLITFPTTASITVCVSRLVHYFY